MSFTTTLTGVADQLKNIEDFPEQNNYFLAYSHGMQTISEEDFARMLLKYTDVADTEEYIATLRKRMPEEKVKLNRHHTRDIIPKRVTSGGIHLHGLAPGRPSSEVTSQR